MSDIKEKILIVEDSDVTLYKVKSIFIRIGYDVFAYNNPIHALDWLTGTDDIPDLVIVDVDMPGMDGFEFIRRVRAQEKMKKMPILLLTSHTETRDKIEGLEAGADDYLEKTVSLTELELRVKALLTRKNSGESISQGTAKTIAVFSLRGGVGVSSLALNLSVAISKLWGIEACLWDLALSMGQCALMMNLKPTTTIASLVDWKERTIDDATINNLLIKHSSGVRLVPAPTAIEDAELITEATIDLIWPGLQSISSYLIIDAGNHFSEAVLTVLDRVDLILLILAPELASVNAAYQAMKLFEKMGYSDQKVLPVINHIFTKNELDSEKIAASLKKQIVAEIPNDSSNMVQAINQGTPYLMFAPKTETGLAIIKLAHQLSSTDKSLQDSA